MQTTIKSVKGGRVAVLAELPSGSWPISYLHAFGAVVVGCAPGGKIVAVDASVRSDPTVAYETDGLGDTLGIACRGSLVYILDSDAGLFGFRLPLGLKFPVLASVGMAASAGIRRRPCRDTEYSALSVSSTGRVAMATPDTHKVIEIASSGCIRPLVGSGNPGNMTSSDSTLDRLDSPSGVCWLPNGGLAIAEAGNGTVRLYSPKMVLERVIGHPTERSATIGNAKAARFNLPSGLAYGDAMYVADNHACVFKVDKFGNMTTAYTSASKIRSISASPDGRLFVAEED